MSILPPVRPLNPLQADGPRLVRADAFGEDGVVEVRTEAHGTIAVGMAGGVPFATSDICRHQAARLGRGAVVDGRLQCPWHRARFDVGSGEMVRGPQGGPYSRGIQLWANTGPVKLRTFAVEVRDGWIVLV